MSRNEFLKKLKEALKLSLDRESINEKLDYYDKYISDEVAKGRSEKEVLDELGDPVLIAKTIKTVSGTDNVIDVNAENNTKRGSSENKRTYVYTGDSRTIIGCFIVLLLVFIIAIAVLRLLGIVLVGATGLAFGAGPFTIIILIVLAIYLFGRR